MIKKCLYICTVLFSTSTLAEVPSYFNKEIDLEYRALIKHVKDMLPGTNLQLAYLPSFYPFSLLDIRPTKLDDVKNKQEFANFNFGVFGRVLLNINEKQLSKLPSISICKKSACTKDRIQLIEEFLETSTKEIESLAQNNQLFIVQQTAPNVYRINNTFYSPAQLITYYPSKHAGFVPSGNYKITKPENAPSLIELSSATSSLREVMAKYNVAAIAKINEESVNVVFGGIGDNHWGVVLNHKSPIPTSGDYNHIGLEYDIVHKLSSNSFYYQTN